MLTAPDLILIRNAELSLHIDQPFPARFGDHAHQALTNIPDLVVFMQQFDVALDDSFWVCSCFFGDRSDVLCDYDQYGSKKGWQWPCRTALLGMYEYMGR